MAFQYSPKIVTNGLVVALDAANKKSYPGSGTTWNDLSGNGNNGTLTNGPTYDSANNGSVVFDGIDDYCIIPPSSSPTGNEITIDLWYSGSNVSTNSTTFRSEYSSTNSAKTFSGHIAWSDGNIYWDCGNNGSGTYDRISKASNGAHYGWHHWVFWKDVSLGTMKIYLDGVQWHSGTGKTLSIPSSTNSYIGGRPTSDYSFGKYSTYKVYNTALTSDEILQNYNSTKARFGL